MLLYVCNLYLIVVILFLSITFLLFFFTEYKSLVLITSLYKLNF